jgi:hypothetical protein
MAIAQILGSLIGAFIYYLLLYLVIRAASVSALRQQLQLGHVNQLLASQAELTARLAKHLIAQTELMLLTAKNDGLTDADLEPIRKQVEERKADPSFNLPFS